MGKLKTILIMAGGTGGHVFPGLAVAKHLHEQGVQVHWLGTVKGIEAKIIPEAGFPFHMISISGIRGKGFTDLLLAPFRLIYAIVQAVKIIREVRPDVVLGMGGFASGPGGIASYLLRKPVIIHEQNAKAGLTNTYLSKVAKKVLEGFPDTFSQAVFTGNPVRAEIVNIVPPDKRFENRQNPLHLLVLGGSLGAQAINELLPQALAQIPLNERPFVLHQTGDKHYEKTVEAYKAAGLSISSSIQLVPFIREMDKAYACADLVLCRAGALTIAELCAAGVGAILVPFPHAVDDHQTANGNFMVKRNAAILIQQKELTMNRLATLLKEFNEDKHKCFSMAKAAYAQRKVDATEKVRMICEEVCSELDI